MLKFSLIGGSLSSEIILRERERERRERNGKVVKDTTFIVRKKVSIFPVLKVPRQCPPVLLEEAAHFIGITFYLFI
jgi:hypothetical protein